MVPEVGIAPTSPRLQRGANLPQLLGEEEIPISKHQAPEKLQQPNLKNPAACPLDVWCLMFLWRLELGIWSFRRLVVPRGNAPRSLAYQASALLLSYRTMAEGVGNAPTSARADPVFKTGAASSYLPAFRDG